MIKRVKQMYCDRCGAEIEGTEYCGVFKSYNLNIKFNKIRFCVFPWQFENGEIKNKYIEERDEALDLCSECTKEFISWWNQKVS